MRSHPVIILVFISTVVVSAQNVVKKSFYTSGKIRSEITYSDSIRNGPAKFYYENGYLKEERNYVNGRVEGTVKLYHKSGTLSEIFSIINSKREGPTSLFDSTGNYINDILYTSGKQETRKIILTPSEKPDSSIKTVIGEIKKADLWRSNPPGLKESQYHNDPAYFIKLDTQPEPIGGMESIYKKLVYPEEARKNNIMGIVDVLTFIDEDGNVAEMTVIKGLGYGCDEAAKNAIRYTKFEPGLIKVVPVKSQIRISVEFNGYNH